MSMISRQSKYIKNEKNPFLLSFTTRTTQVSKFASFPSRSCVIKRFKQLAGVERQHLAGMANDKRPIKCVNEMSLNVKTLDKLGFFSFVYLLIEYFFRESSSEEMKTKMEIRWCAGGNVA
jgi:hypothetical protein